jgi:hypothetical protein
MRKFMKNPFETQQTRGRKEMKSLGRADKAGITDAELVQEMTKDMNNPESAKSIIQAASAVLYMRGVKNGDTPITDATNRCLEKKKKARKSVLSLKSA